jgi:hypothetical protein
MGLAFEAACAELQNNLMDLVCEMIAERIIEAARRGERDPGRLSSFAVAAIRRNQRTGDVRP